MLPDLAVVAIAERPPKSRGELSKVRGLDGRHVKAGAGDELLEAVTEGLELTEDELRLPARDGVDSTYRPAVTLASAWVSQLSRDADLDASLVATRADIEGLVRGDGTSRLLTGWRADVAGRPVQDLLKGEAALAFDGDGQLVLEKRSHEPAPAVRLTRSGGRHRPRRRSGARVEQDRVVGGRGDRRTARPRRRRRSPPAPCPPGRGRPGRRPC